jgi:threonine/homoserine/homoserine lactone efflux protein
MRLYSQHAEDGQRAGTYVALTAAMNSHAIGRGRGGPHAALAVTGKVSLSTMTSALTMFLPAAVLFAVSPGAGNFLAMRNGARYGTRVAICGFAGRFVSFLVLFLAVALGLGAIIAASEIALTIIKWCGVTYLVWLGVQALWTNRRGHADDDTSSPRHSAEHARSAKGNDPGPPGRMWPVARQEFLTSITNPKALLLISAFLPQSVVPGSRSQRSAAADGGRRSLHRIGVRCRLWLGQGRSSHVQRRAHRHRPAPFRVSSPVSS